MVLWIIIYSTTEFMIKRSNKIKVTANGESGGNKMSGKMDVLLALQVKTAVEIKYFSWEDINKEVSNGKILVVANGKYVYDATQWIKSHPGGKIILYSVGGTDISNDYFQESGFDASEFVPKKYLPKKQGRGQIPNLVESIPDTFDSSNFDETKFDLQQTKFDTLTSYVNLNEEEIALVVKSRRTHVHSRLAMERISSLLIGEIPAPLLVEQSTPFLPGPQFTKFEYRRYGLIGKAQLTEDARSWKLKFALLYPYNSRLNEPQMFDVGDVVEICVRHPNGTMQTRYYTPINGNLAAFEIIFSVKKDGWMTEYLSNQRCGDRQFKIRGPFGQTLVKSISTDYGEVYEMPDNLVFLCAGSGITPLLQMIEFLILPKNEPLSVFAEFHPSSPDEIALEPGHYVVVLEHYYDGWAFGTNLNTNQTGVFPISIAIPKTGRNYHITLINCVQTIKSIIGLQLIEAVLVTYPGLLTVHHFVSEQKQWTRDGVSGQVHMNRVDEEDLNGILGGIGDGHGQQEGTRLAVVCGTVGFNGVVVDLLVGCGWWQDDVRILGDSEPIK